MNSTSGPLCLLQCFHFMVITMKYAFLKKAGDDGDDGDPEDEEAQFPCDPPCPFGFKRSWQLVRHKASTKCYKTCHLCVTSVTRDSMTWKWKSYTLRKGGATHHQSGYLMFDLTCATLNVAMLRMICIWMICKCNCFLSKTSQELRMLSRSLSDCAPYSSMS